MKEKKEKENNFLLISQRFGPIQPSSDYKECRINQKPLHPSLFKMLFGKRIIIRSERVSLNKLFNVYLFSIDAARLNQI